MIVAAFSSTLFLKAASFCGILPPPRPRLVEVFCGQSFPTPELKKMRRAFSQSNNGDVLLSICASKRADSEP